jgi:hypothetical protein
MSVMQIRRRRSRRSPPDPRYHQVFLDAHIFDESDDLEITSAVAEILGPMRESVSILLPYSVKAEIERPQTPASVKALAAELIYSTPVQLSQSEIETHIRLRIIMKGNALSNRHDADAFHVVEAGKYGGYFVTLDRRILRKKNEISSMIPGLWIVKPQELVSIFSATRHEA